MQLFNLAKNLNKNDKHKEKKLSIPMIKNLRKRSRSRKTLITNENDDVDEDDDDETDNETDMKARKKTNSIKRKTKVSKEQPLEEPRSKKQRRTATTTVATAAFHEKRTPRKRIGRADVTCVSHPDHHDHGYVGKSSAGSSDACTSVEEENEETRLIEQSKLYIEGPGSRPIVFSFVHTHSPFQEFDRTTRESMHTIQG